MLEVMMLGILVSLIKIAELATVDAGIGMFAVWCTGHSVPGDHAQF